jgi:hypothetical protein
MNKYIYSYQLYATAIGLLFLVAGCDEDTTKMRLWVYDREVDTYRLEDVEITTLHDIHRLDGDATNLKAGLSLVLNYQNNTLDWKKEADSVAFSAIRKDGVLIPTSFDALAMASIYYNMELSYLFFKDDLKMGNDILKRLPTYYDPKIRVVESDGTESTMTDNAFYMKISENERGFFIVPFEMFQCIPISLNTGIITHEYTHYVFDRVLMDYLPVLDAKSQNFLRSLNEAIADYMAVARTSDPDFMAPSIPPNLFVTPTCNALQNMELSRDISNPISPNYTESMDNWARNVQDINEFCPYEIGLMSAGMFYQMAAGINESDSEPSKQSMTVVAGWILKSLKDLKPVIVQNHDFELWDMFNQLVNATDDSYQKALLCEIIGQRYSMYFSEVKGC